jgi:hypothetical protein
VISARFPNRETAEPFIEMLEGAAFRDEAVRRQGVRIENTADGAVIVMVVEHDESMNLRELFTRAGAEVSED